MKVIISLCLLGLLLGSQISSGQKYVSGNGPANDGEPHCVMYQKCTDTLNCVYSGPPQKLDPDNLETLRTWCPELVEEYGDQLCCSGEQLIDLASNLALPQSILTRCPSCYYNLRQAFCHLTCSPVQSKFLRVNKTVGEEPNLAVAVLHEFVAEGFVQGTFESCVDVHIRTDEDEFFAMELMCGMWGRANCTGHRWFDYLGSATNGFAPFDIIYKYSEGNVEGFQPFNPTIIPCTDAPPGVNRTCACKDCAAACPKF